MIVDKEDVPELFDKVALDGDVVVYRGAFAVESTKYHLYGPDKEFVETFHSHKDMKGYLKDVAEFFETNPDDYTYESEKIIGTEQDAIDACEVIMKYIKNQCPSKSYKVYLTGKGNYREQIAKSAGYKENRKDVPKPVHYQAVKDHLINNHGAIIVNGVESDDACGVIGYQGHLGKAATCTVSIDKDFLNVPALHYNFVDNVWNRQSEEEADHFLWKQILTGDKVDNILGLVNVSDEFRKKYSIKKSKGIGPAAAEKILDGCKSSKECAERVIEAYKSYYGNEWRGYLQEAGKLVYILREKDKIWDLSWYGY